MTDQSADGARDMLRHTLATLAYRSRKAVTNPPAGFSDYSVGPGSRTPGQILAHMRDLFDWALSMAQGEQRWSNSTPAEWDADCARYFASLAAFEAHLASDMPLGHPAKMLFQGPIADALTHTGQLTMLRRLAGGPIRGENYAKADIRAGRVGADQAAPRMEFD